MESEYKVKLLVFSGRPDPVFSVSSKHAKFNDVKEHLEKAKTKLDLTPAVASKMGYKGFLIQEKDQHHHIAHCEAAHLQHLLLGIGVESNEISPELRDVVTKSIDVDEVGTFIKKVSPTLSDVGIGKNPGPPLNLGKWNDLPYVTGKNNCYNYGTDAMTCTFAQPGRGTGHKYSDILPNDVLGGAVFDGLKLVDPQPLSTEPVPAPSKEQWLVALVVSTDPGLKDYHWYRLDNNGLWSHKPGSTPATTVDGKGNEITDPRNAANSGIPYKFVAFMYSKPTSPIS